VTLERPPLQIEILDTANALVELAGLLSWGWSPVGAESCPGQGKTWQDGGAAVGSFGFKVTTSLWHWSRFESEDR
jgi:hypothetical protein